MKNREYTPWMRRVLGLTGLVAWSEFALAPLGPLRIGGGPSRVQRRPGTGRRYPGLDVPMAVGAGGMATGTPDSSAAPIIVTPYNNPSVPTMCQRPDFCTISPSIYSAGHGRAVYDLDQGCYTCDIAPPKCDCHVIGGNTLNSTTYPAGVPSDTLFTIEIDSGDSDFFVPYWMNLFAFEVGATPSLSVTGDEALFLLADSESGKQPNLHRADPNDPSYGISSFGYGSEKDATCVDWRRFSSTKNQRLKVTGRNIQDFNTHNFVVIWGLPSVITGPCTIK